MATGAQTFSNVDFKDFFRKEPKRNSNGGFNSYIDLDSTTKQAPRIQWSECIAKFGISEPMEGSTRRNLELSVKDDSMLTWLRGFDRANIEHVAEYSETYFKKKLTEDVLGQTLYRYSAPDHPEGKYEPLWRIKVQLTGKGKTNFYKVEEEVGADGKKEQVIVPCDAAALQPWCRVVAITNLTGLWFVSKGFGCTYAASDVLIYEQPKKRQGDFVGLGMRVVKKAKNDGSNDSPINPRVNVDIEGEKVGEAAVQEHEVEEEEEEVEEDDIV